MSEYPKTMYRAKNREISAFKVVSETPHFVTIETADRRGGVSISRERKVSTGFLSHEYFDSWEAAKESLLAKAEKKVVEARAYLQRTHDELGNIKGMKPPKAES